MNEINKFLKLCPFCGSDADINYDPRILPNGAQDLLYYVECTLRECGCRTMSWYPKEAAIQAWNRRI